MKCRAIVFVLHSGIILINSQPAFSKINGMFMESANSLYSLYLVFSLGVRVVAMDFASHPFVLLYASVSGLELYNLLIALLVKYICMQEMDLMKRMLMMWHPHYSYIGVEMYWPISDIRISVRGFILSNIRTKSWVEAFREIGGCLDFRRILVTP